MAGGRATAEEEEEDEEEVGEEEARAGLEEEWPAPTVLCGVAARPPTRQPPGARVSGSAALKPLTSFIHSFPPSITPSLSSHSVIYLLIHSLILLPTHFHPLFHLIPSLFHAFPPLFISIHLPKHSCTYPCIQSGRDISVLSALCKARHLMDIC